MAGTQTGFSAEPQRGIAYEFYIGVLDAITGNFRIDPTILAGDFRVSKDGGAFENLATLPTVQPTGSSNIRVNLSAFEMDSNKIVVEGLDNPVGFQWDGVRVFIDAPNSGPAQAAKVVLDGFTLARDNTKGLRRSAGNRIK